MKQKVTAVAEHSVERLDFAMLTVYKHGLLASYCFFLRYFLYIIVEENRSVQITWDNHDKVNLIFSL